VTTSFATKRIPRLQAGATRVRELASQFGDRLTSPDPSTQERWDLGQVLSHLAELFPYWLEEVHKVVAAGGQVPFGRVKSTPSRLERIEAGRHEDPGHLLDQMDAGVTQTVSLLQGLSEEELELVGHHQSMGDMTLAQAIDEFLVGHLEQHADQLAEALRLPE
jgi:hypothetical protein